MVRAVRIFRMWASCSASSSCSSASWSFMAGLKRSTVLQLMQILIEPQPGRSRGCRGSVALSRWCPQAGHVSSRTKLGFCSMKFGFSEIDVQYTSRRQAELAESIVQLSPGRLGLWPGQRDNGPGFLFWPREARHRGPKPAGHDGVLCVAGIQFNDPLWGREKLDVEMSVPVLQHPVMKLAGPGRVLVVELLLGHKNRRGAPGHVTQGLSPGEDEGILNPLACSEPSLGTMGLCAAPHRDIFCLPRHPCITALTHLFRGELPEPITLGVKCQRRQLSQSFSPALIDLPNDRPGMALVTDRFWIDAGLLEDGAVHVFDRAELPGEDRLIADEGVDVVRRSEPVRVDRPFAKVLRRLKSSENGLLSFTLHVPVQLAQGVTSPGALVDFFCILLGVRNKERRCN